MQPVFSLLLLGGALFVAVLAYIRLAPHDVAAVHVDPLETGIDSRNAAYVAAGSTVYDMAPEALYAALTGVITRTPRTERLAEGPEPFHATYVARTAVMGYPDYVSLRVVPTEGGSTYALYSRSRFGASDLGANAARLADWRAALEAALAGS